MDSVDGEILERFELLGLAGRGGMGRVYRARDRDTGDLVALKLLPQDGGDRLRFAREADILSGLDHPAIVRYRDGGLSGRGVPYLVMEWLEGDDLATRLSSGPLDVAGSIALMTRVADGLATAHRRGIIHRDLKPANVFLVGGAAASAKLIDFGVARPVNSDTLTADGAIVGTPAFMAPEQVSGQRADERADVYGLGALLFSCLVGQPPFRGPHDIAVLAKVVLEEPPSVRALRPEVPESLATLVRRLLAKAPENRPPDAASVHDELRSLAQDREAASSVEVISSTERRVTSFVLSSLRVRREADTLVAQASPRRHQLGQDIASSFGGTMHPLLHGAMIVTLRAQVSPAEQATRAARCALAIAADYPAAPVVVATGRVVVSGDLQVGEAIDRAADAVLSGDTTGVVVDETTADLLGHRFEIQGEGRWRALLSERTAGAAPAMLLGRVVPCLGRTRELAQLEAMFAECVDESRAQLALITAPAGLGKSRLLHEFLETQLAARGPCDLLAASADLMRAGSTFALASRILATKAMILETDPPSRRGEKLRDVLRGFDRDDAKRLEEFLGEIVGAYVSPREASPELRAARADLATMLDVLEEVWVKWIGARAASQPVVMALEDLQWADLPSLRLIDAAIASLPDRALFVVATARPELHQKFPNVFARRAFQEIRLGPLSARTAESLVRESLATASDDTIRSIVERAAGHPFYLEEIVRAVAKGQRPDALPDSVLGMVQARFDDLAPAARQTLRVASVFGESFWEGAVQALMKGEARTRVAAHLRSLVEQELLMRRSTSRIRGEVEYQFRHAILRDAAHETLTDEARAVAHRLAGAWLEKSGENDPAVLADHFDRGGVVEKAGPYFLQAARRALDASDLDRAERYAERAAACGPDEATVAAIAAIEADVAYWRGEIDRAVARADDATKRLVPASAEWFGAASTAISALGQRGRNDEVAAWMKRVARSTSDERARPAHAVALCRAMAQLLWAHHRDDLAAVRERFDELASSTDAEDPFVTGWVHRVRAESAWLHDGDVDRCLAEFEKSRAAFDAARAVRLSVFTAANEACMAAWSGDVDRGVALAARAREDAARVGARFLVSYASAVSGLAMSIAGHASAEEAMRTALPPLAGSTRLAFICRFYVGWLALERGDLEVAGENARLADELDVVADLKCAGAALVARVELARGSIDVALAAAKRGFDLRRGCKDLELTDGVAELALAEVYEAMNDRDSAVAVLDPALGRIAAIAETVGTEERRARFRDRRIANDRITRLLARAR